MLYKITRWSCPATLETCRTNITLLSNSWSIHMAWHSTVWHSTAQHSTAWHGMTQYGTVWHGKVWHSTTLYSTAQHRMAQHGMVWHSMAQYGMEWHDTAWHGMVWHSMAQHGMARYRMAWHSMAWHSMTGGVWYSDNRSKASSRCNGGTSELWSSQRQVELLSQSRNTLSTDNHGVISLFYVSTKALITTWTL